MAIKGRILTDDEAARTRAHYRKNAGVKWDLKNIAKLVVRGAEEAQKDEHTRDALTNGMMMCNEDSGK